MPREALREKNTSVAGHFFVFRGRKEKKSGILVLKVSGAAGLGREAGGRAESCCYSRCPPDGAKALGNAAATPGRDLMARW